jgi:type IV pilus biogenesis protein CpaD/CtpE
MPLRPYITVLALALTLGAAACTPDPEPITFNDGTITVQNLTSAEWRNVMITVNDHYRGGAPSLAPNGRMNAPISQFQTAYGEKYVAARQPVVKIEVTATDVNGRPVKLLWGERQ